MHTSEPWLQTRLNKPFHCFATGLSCVKVHQDETEGLSLQPEGLRVSEVQRRGRSAYALCTEGPWEVHADALKHVLPHVGF